MMNLKITENRTNTCLELLDHIILVHIPPPTPHPLPPCITLEVTRKRRGADWGCRPYLFNLEE